jgi:hypothetical protein
MHTLFLNIFNNFFELKTTSSDIHARLSLDFQYFITNNSIAKFYFKIHVILESPPWNDIPKKHLIKQTATSIIYEKDGVRYNDYHDSALTIVNYKSNEGCIYTEDLHLAHELSYLLILSRSGKSMDLAGYHKIHAMGVQFNSTNILFTTPSGGGKSTLFLGLLKDEKMRIFSDDTPVIDSTGRIHAFPLRIGLEANTTLPFFINPDDIYKLRRRKYGEKTLIPFLSLKRELAQFGNSTKTILMIAKRVESGAAGLIKVNRFRLVPELIRSMIVGVGLPMILEYFLESGPADIQKRFIIIFKRLRAALQLLIRSETYLFNMSSNVEENVRILKEKISNKD